MMKYLFDMTEAKNVKDRILFWLEGGLIQFGIAKFLQEKYEYDAFAIINVNKTKNFYQNQQLIKFQKVWYYREHLSKTRKPDLKYLSSFEEKYKINLWSVAYSDVIFYKYNPYHKFNSDEILSIFEQECRFFENVLDEVKPDFLIIRITDSSNTQILQMMCKSRGIKILTLGFPRFVSRANISEDLDVLDEVEEDFENSYNYKNKTIEELQAYLQGYTKQQQTFRTRFRTSKTQWIKAVLRYVTLILNNKYRKYYVHYGRTLFNVIIHEGSFYLKRRYRQFFINKNLHRKINSMEKFVYFPLQLEPERTLLMQARFYTNQLEVITNIAKSLPVDYELYVKEHHMQIIRGWRPISFYKQVMDLPNVKLLHPSVPNDEMIKNCSLVISLAGTSGLEAAFHKKPSIVFADLIYTRLPSVHRLKSIEDLPQAIRTSLQKEVDISDLNKFTSIVEKNSFEFDTTDLINQINDRFFYGGFLFDEDIPILEAESFLEENRSTFEKLAMEHIKKITEYKKLINVKKPLV